MCSTSSVHCYHRIYSLNVFCTFVFFVNSPGRDLLTMVVPVVVVVVFLLLQYIIIVIVSIITLW